MRQDRKKRNMGENTLLLLYRRGYGFRGLSEPSAGAEWAALPEFHPVSLYGQAGGADGKPIYVIDGLDLGAEDFAYPGTNIEEEMIPYIEAALSGETIYSKEIVDTTWGHIFTACYPVVATDGTGRSLVPFAWKWIWKIPMLSCATAINPRSG